MEGGARDGDGDRVGLLHRLREGALEGGAVPGVGLGGAADVKVDQLVEEGLEDVAAADPGIGRD